MSFQAARPRATARVSSVATAGSAASHDAWENRPSHERGSINSRRFPNGSVTYTRS